MTSTADTPANSTEAHENAGGGASWRSFTGSSRGKWIAVIAGVLVLGLLTILVRGGDSSVQSTNSSADASVEEAQALVLEAVDLINGMQYDAGIERLQEAIALDPANALAYYNIGVAHHFSGNLDEAFAAYSQALSVDNVFDSAYYNRGLVQRDQGKLREAVADLKIAAALKPANAAAHYNLGQILISLGEAEEGEAAVAKAREINPTIGQ